MIRNDINELALATAFIQVVHAGSFAAAARVLNKASSSLTRAVADLERHLGVQLLIRSTRKLQLSEAGEIYLKHADAMLAARSNAHEAILALSGEPKGRLRVSMPTSVGERLMAPALTEFHQRYPEVTLDLDLSDRIVELIGEGFDVALRVGPLADSTHKAVKLTDMEILLCASPDYIVKKEKQGIPLTDPSHLSLHPCLALSHLTGPVRWGFVNRQHSPTAAENEVERVTVMPWLRSSSVQLIRIATADGLGIARLPTWAVQPDLASKKLVPVLRQFPCEPPSPDAGMYAVYATTASGQPPLKSRIFVEFIRELIRRSYSSLPIF